MTINHVSYLYVLADFLSMSCFYSSLLWILVFPLDIYSRKAMFAGFFFLPESNYAISAVFDNWTTINCSSKWLILFASTFLHRNTSAETRKILFMASHLIYLNWYINSVQCVWQKFSTDRLFENEIMPTVDKKNLIVQISFALLNFS